jgi:hypothetical protein
MPHYMELFHCHFAKRKNPAPKTRFGKPDKKGATILGHAIGTFGRAVTQVVFACVYSHILYTQRIGQPALANLTRTQRGWQHRQ